MMFGKIRYICNMKNIPRIIVRIGMVLVLLGALAGFMAWKYVNAEYRGEAAWLYIPAGASDTAVHDSLQSVLGKSIGGRVYTIWSHVSDNHARAHGAYMIETGSVAKDIARRLVRGAQTPMSFTFNNMRTFGQLADRVGDKFEISASDFMHACDSVLPAAGFKKQEYVAAFLPDTYEFYWTASPEHIVERLLEYRNRFWTDERRSRAASLGLSPVKVATLASIVEEETNNGAERPIVARLYLNRLSKGILLQADPTVKWAVGDFALRRITGKHLGIDSPYNTYKYKGLPPGPIRIPERATLESVLDAPHHDYIYMCAKPDFSGTHNFAVDFAAHQRNAARYQAALNRRNIK